MTSRYQRDHQARVNLLIRLFEQDALKILRDHGIFTHTNDIDTIFVSEVDEDGLLKSFSYNIDDGNVIIDPLSTDERWKLKKKTKISNCFQDVKHNKMGLTKTYSRNNFLFIITCIYVILDRKADEHNHYMLHYHYGNYNEKYGDEGEIYN
jgi:hypothetical protein